MNQLDVNVTASAKKGSNQKVKNYANLPVTITVADEEKGEEEGEEEGRRCHQH